MNLIQFVDVKNVLIKLQDIFQNNLNNSQRAYVIGFLLSLPTLICYALNINDLSKGFYVLLVGVLIYGSVMDLLAIHKLIWNTTLGKALLTLAFFALTTFSYAISETVVNGIVQYDATALSHTVKLMTVATVPILALLIFIAILMLYVLLLFVLHMTYYMVGHDLFPKLFKTESYPLFTLFIRFFVYMFLLSVLTTNFDDTSNRYTKFVESNAKSFIHNFEAKTYSRCQLAEGQKAITVNDDEIIISEKEENGNITFTPQLCEPKLKSNP